MKSKLGHLIARHRPLLWFLGIGFWWAAWFSEGFKGSSWLSVGQHGPLLMQAGFLIGTVPYALTFLLLIALRKRLTPLHERRSLLVGAALVAGAGIALASSKSTAILGPVGSVAGVVLTQAAGAVLILAWWELCCAVGARQTWIGVSASIIVGAGLHLVLLAVAPHAPLAAAIALGCFPLLCLASLLMAWREPSVPALDPGLQTQPFKMPGGVVAGLFSYGFATGFMVALTTLQPHPGSGIASTSALWNGGTALVILVIALSWGTSDLRFLTWSILLSLAVGFMLLPVAGYVLANDVAHVGIICVSVFWITVCADISRRAPAPALAAAGWGALANAGGSAMGGLVCAVLLSVTTLSSWHLSVIALAVVSLQMFTSGPLLGSSALAVLWGLVRPATPAPEMPEGLVEARCAEIAVAQRLTPREREILVLLAESRTADEIGRQLVISDATVRTHIKRIHEKLDVHSQPQLIRMILFDERTDIPAGAGADPVSS
jgi:DNA-binding CsgD family transcriptional regulator